MGRTKGSKNKATKKWEAYWLAKESRKAELQAEQEEDRKHPERKILRWIKGIVGDKGMDLVEVAAVIATTYVIHGIILTSAELFQRASNISKGLTLISGAPDILSQLPFADTPLGWVSNIPFLVNTILQGQEGLSEERKKQIVEGITKTVEKPDSDSLYIWAVSLAIAYYVQKHGIPDIHGAIKGFLGVAAAA